MAKGCGKLLETGKVKEKVLPAAAKVSSVILAQEAPCHMPHPQNCT